MGDALGIAHGPKQGLNSSPRNRRKEVAQVDSRHDAFANVRRGERTDRSASPKPVSCRMGGNKVQNAGQNPALQLFEPRLGRFDQPNAPKSLCQHTVVVVPQAAVPLLGFEMAPIGKPIEITNRNSQPIGKFARSKNHQQIPARRSCDRTHRRRHGQASDERQSMPLASRVETRVAEDEVGDGRLPGSRPIGKFGANLPSKRAKPSPAFAE